MAIAPEQYGSTGVLELLEAAARGHVPFDHRILHALFARSEETIAAILAFGQRDLDADPVDISDDLVLIARHLHTSALLPFLISRLREQAADPSDDLVEAICAHGQDALEPLLALDDEFGDVAPSETPFILASLGIEDRRIGERLDRMAQTDKDEAAFCLDVYLATSKSPRNPEPFDIWELFPDEEEPAFEVLSEADLAEFLQCPSPELRAAAAASVSARHAPSAGLIDLLKEVSRGDSEPAVRGAAWQSLALLVEDEKFQEAMIERLAAADTPSPERAGLAIGLVVVSTDDRVSSAVTQLYEDKSTREAALEAMWRSKDRRYAPLAVLHLDDPDPDLRHHAILAVGHLELKGELQRVESLFTDEEFRSTALMAYALATPTKVSPAYMRNAFRKVETLAGGLDPEEADLVRQALDHRLELHGFPPMFESEETGLDEE